MTTFVQLGPAPLVNVNEPAGVGIGATAFTFGPFCMRGFLNGRIRGNAHQDQDGTMLLEWSVTPTGFPVDLSFDVPRDTNQPDFQWPFDVIVLQPYLRVSFTNGGVASSFFRANVEALPI